MKRCRIRVDGGGGASRGFKVNQVNYFRCFVEELWFNKIGDSNTQYRKELWYREVKTKKVIQFCQQNSFETNKMDIRQ